MQTEIAKVLCFAKRPEVERLLCKATGGRALASQASRAGADFELLTVVESQMLRASFTSTFRWRAISSSVLTSGCTELVHHFDTVAGSLPNCSANIFIDFDSEPTTLLRVDSLKVNKNLSHFIQIKILSTNKVVPKMPV